MSHEPEPEAEEIETTEAATPSLDDVIDSGLGLKTQAAFPLPAEAGGSTDTAEELAPRAEGRWPDTQPARDGRTLVGEVVETDSAEHRDRVLVRWRNDEDEPHLRWLSVLRGLDLGAGDRVLLSKPGNWHGWIVTGAIQGNAVADAVADADAPEISDVSSTSTSTSTELEVEVDGKRVEVVGEDEIVLRCGEASITLRRNGRVVIRGTYVETRSRGTNRIKGGSVQIN